AGRPCSDALTTRTRAHEGSLILLEDEYRVVPTEAEAVAQRYPQRHATRRVRNTIQIARRIRSLEVDRGRHDVVAQGEHRERGLDRAGRTEAMPGRAVRRGHGDRPRRLPTKGELDGSRLCRVTDARRARVRIHVV